MKISIIHNLYRKNPFVAGSIRLNLKALECAKIDDYEYILFNDNGDESIFADVKHFINSKVKYYYSDINYGKKQCTGGWLGAEDKDLISGDIIHNIGQDDVMTSLFYSEAIKKIEYGYWFFTSNGYKVDESLNLLGILIHPDYNIDYSQPYSQFINWFGIKNNKVTQANNGMLASGTIYRRHIHNIIGLPNLDEFAGAADFEYWARILFNELKGNYSSLPLWYYRMSAYSAGNEIINGKPNRGHWQQLAIEKIKEKYSKLYKEL